MSLTAATSGAPNSFCLDCRPPLEPLTDLLSGLFGLMVAALVVAATIRAGKKLAVDGPQTFQAAPGIGLTADYRRKLIHWLSSETILILATVLGLCVTWFVYLSRIPAEKDGALFADYMAFPLALSLEFYLFAFVPILVWHLADFVTGNPPRRKTLAFLTSHASLSGILVCLGLINTSLATGWFTVDRPCGGMFVILSQTCIGPHPAMALPFKLSLLSLPILALLKLAVSLHSRLGRQR